MDGTNGATAVKGTLVVTEASTQTGLANLNGGIAVDTNLFTVDGANGATAVKGTLHSTGNVSVNNDKFVVTAFHFNWIIIFNC